MKEWQHTMQHRWWEFHQGFSYSRTKTIGYSSRRMRCCGIESISDGWRNGFNTRERHNSVTLFFFVRFVVRNHDTDCKTEGHSHEISPYSEQSGDKECDSGKETDYWKHLLYGKVYGFLPDVDQHDCTGLNYTLCLFYRTIWIFFTEFVKFAYSVFGTNKYKTTFVNSKHFCKLFYTF